MEWTFEDFKTDLDNLTPQVRAKALQIATELMKEGNISEKKALDQAIMRAEEWLYDSEG